MAHATEAKEMPQLRFAVLVRCVFLLLTFGAGGFAHADSMPATIQKALKQARIPESALSISIVPVQGGGQPFSLNAERAINPASLMKLVTTYSALELLGPAYQWPTELRALSQPSNGVLNADLYLKGYGDPKLTQERIWLLLRDLKLSGVREIRGDLVLDRSYFQLNQGRNAFDDDGNKPEQPYLVTPDALLTNFKSLRLLVRAEKEQISARLDPALPEVKLENYAQLGAETECANWRANLLIKIEDSGKQAQVMLSGTVPAGCAGERYLALLDHSTYSASLIKSLWAELGGTWLGDVRQGVAPKEAQVLMASWSPALPLMLRDINKYSNNTMARQVYLTLGAEKGLPTDSSETARRSEAVVRRWVLAKGWSWPELVLENGSGLSRNERISTQHLTDLLSHAWHGTWAAEFVSSLPIVAIDGTMKQRLVGEALAGEAHIKTGTLKGVRSIAGYVRGNNGSVWAVTAAINHPKASATGKYVLDEVLRYAGSR